MRDGADMFGIQERFFTAWAENGGGSQNINVVIEPSVKLRQHSVYCCKDRDLGTYIDSDMSMKTHVSRTVSSCFAALRRIRSIRRSVCQPVLLSLVTSLVLTRLDYGSVTLNGITISV